MAATTVWRFSRSHRAVFPAGATFLRILFPTRKIMTPGSISRTNFGRRLLAAAAGLAGLLGAGLAFAQAPRATFTAGPTAPAAVRHCVGCGCAVTNGAAPHACDHCLK